MRHNLTEQNSVLDRIRKGELPAKSSAEKPSVPRQEVPVPDGPGIEKPSDPSVKRSVKPDAGTPHTPKKGAPNIGSFENPVNQAGELIYSDRVMRDLNKNIISPHLIADLEKATAMAKIGDVQFTFARQDHSPRGNHLYGLAADISAFRVNNKFIYFSNNPVLFTTLGNIFVEQLKKLGYTFGEAPTKERAYLWQTYIGGDHYHHVHVSNIRGKEGIDPKSLDSRKEDPFRRQLQTHAKVLSFFRKYYNWIRDAEKNFEKFTWKVLDWGDDEKGAYKYYNEQVTKGLKAYNLDSESVYNNASKQDKHNIQMIKYIIERIGNLIQQGHQGKYPMTLYIYDSTEKKWKTKKVWFIWDAM